MLHVLIGQDIFYERVIAASKTTRLRWVLPKVARMGDRVALYFPSQGGFVALGSVLDTPIADLFGRRHVYVATVGSIERLGSVVSLDWISTRMRGWAWLNYPRNYTSLEPPRDADLLRALGQPAPSTPPKPGKGATTRTAAQPTDDGALEGIAHERTVLTRSRNAALRDEALRRAKGVCKACKVDFSLVLDGLGVRVLQVHHLHQIALLKVPRVNKQSDLAVLCANCHSLVHANTKEAISVDQLARKLARQRVSR